MLTNPGNIRRILLATACLGAMAFCAWLHAMARQDDTVPLRIRLVDAATGKTCTGIVRIVDRLEKRPVPLPGLYDRLRGLKTAPEYSGWHVAPIGGVETKVPRDLLVVEAVAGLETQMARVEINTKRDLLDEVIVKLEPAFDPSKSGLIAGNTHLHLMKLTKDDAEDYLRKIPPADRLRVLFLSYLERFKDDAEYITNRYPIGDLPEFTATGVLVNNGEEHRHNFMSHAEGYGHVMFLNIQKLVKPVSLGPGITGNGDDDRPLRPGIDDARRQGGTVIWCHNNFGHEDVLNALTGRLHALNVFDGSRRGNFEENYYRYLNIGLKLPISTGTDWFLYDFSRVYVRGVEPLTIPAWLDGLKAGRNQATNGPLLSLRVDDHDCGDSIQLAKAGKLKIEARAVGRHDFTELQLIHNGTVIRRQKAEGKALFQANLSTEVRVEETGWFAVRIESKTTNELGYQLFAHTSPVYVDVAGHQLFDRVAAQALLDQIEQGRAAIQKQGRFSGKAAEEQLLAKYTEAAANLRGRINQRNR